MDEVVYAVTDDFGRGDDSRGADSSDSNRTGQFQFRGGRLDCGAVPSSDPSLHSFQRSRDALPAVLDELPCENVLQNVQGFDLDFRIYPHGVIVLDRFTHNGNGTPWTDLRGSGGGWFD